ncbi:hypothetical protein [Tahibacter harae]|uniref:DUF4238 domain-containing protein n=1 Tax=Tahibacter harae TaxID=2963937 RepID=A0ABT1QVS0_9GAMM|nr:hypothetical protein [Tahibacter harae]MCQ4166388.1 hypothetical protein [Tahibacter harae]
MKTMLLPQYQQSQAFMERFLVAAHKAGISIERCRSDANIQTIDIKEMSLDRLDYFVQHKDSFRREFCEDLSEKISRDDFQLFCEVISNDWFDGKRLRVEGRSRRLKRSVLDYLKTICQMNSAVESFVQTTDLPTDVEPLIPIQSIAAILATNDQMILRHTHEWKKIHSNYDTLSNNDIFLRRGLALDRELSTEHLYSEWDFINSYSIAFTCPEKFSQLVSGNIPAIVNGDIALFDGRVLFFSPFIPDMEVGQLEFGIIPSDKPLPIRSQGVHSGIYEYLLDPI